MYKAFASVQDRHTEGPARLRVDRRAVLAVAHLRMRIWRVVFFGERNITRHTLYMYV
jgi:hypothetical protein